MPSRPYTDVTFGPYLPDLGGLPIPERAAYLTDALNVRSTPVGYRGMPAFANVTSATAMGGSALSTTSSTALYRPAAGNFAFFSVANGGKVFESRNEGADTWEDVSPTGTGVSPFVDFFTFGDEVVIVGPSRAPVKKDITASHATLFTDLGGSPPTANTGARVRAHAVLGQLSTDAYGIRTSAIGDHEDWPTPGTADARSKQSIYESLNPEYGAVIRILGGEKIGIVMQQHALTRMTYVGGSTVYEFDVYEKTQGIGGISFLTHHPASDGRLWYWYNAAGVFVTDGYSIKNISEGKIAEALFANSISHTNGTSLKTSYTSAYDDRRGLIIFGGSSYTGVAKYQLIYNIQTDSFSLANETNEMGVFNGFSTSSTTALTDRQIYNINGSDRKLQRLSGATGSIALQTGYIELDPGYRVQLQGAQLLGPGTSGLTISYKAAATASACDVSQSGFTSMTAAPRGEMKTARATSKYFAFRITGTGAESQLIKGIRVYFERAEPAP